ncbi:sulfotransferase [[Phormidium ambiguum] IAM M-71]|uniref:Sulfotransferase n=1 Tax=[Phormidium ambiguum] IAM M-71 TaxID=454136 RepID=A0A1U7IIZ4_9CYAN|nr:sulfotransferase [Phormidium ambiguum]OKH37067.1 sulfotransferase [Phormidium ambiguum IAM M-71]
MVQELTDVSGKNSAECQPDFIIIGAQKCGTTSLYQYLIQHPQIVPASQKEVHFFDLNFAKGVDWYRQQFQTVSEGLITGEASPYYIFHPLVAQRIYELFPQVKLIALLRNPVERAISHYYHEVRLGFEKLSLEDAIAQESARLKGETAKMLADANYYSYNHQHYTYLSRGIYAEQLKHWMQFFPKEQLLVLPSEELYNQPNMILNQVLEFLQLPSFQLTQYEKYNSGEYPEVNQEICQQLQAYFQPYNQELAELLGVKFAW